MPGDVLRPGERVDDADSDRDGGYRAIEQPVGTGYPPKPTAGPTRPRLIPSRLFPIPNPLDPGPFLGIFEVTHETANAFGELAMKHGIISPSPDSAPQTPERRG